MNLNQYSIAAAQPGLSVERILNIWIPVPNLYDQEQISSHITNQIDTIKRSIEQANIEISLLNEYRIRLIADVVTGKLDVRAASATLPDETEGMEAFEEEELQSVDAEDQEDLEPAEDEREA